VPRILTRIYANVTNEVNQLGACVRWLFGYTLNNNLSNLENDGYVSHGILGNAIFKKIKNQLGGNVKFILTGSAPIKSEVLMYLKAVLNVNICECYGLTETAGGCSGTYPDEKTAGHVGYPHYCCLYRLKDHPDLNYTSDNIDSNVENGVRVWKGEILIKGGCLSKKYLLNPEANKEFENGWFRTGDVGTLDQYGKLRITDRIKNIFKLCMGEYVAPEAVENIIATCPLVQQN